MENNTTLILIYVLFIWMVVLHTFEEIAQLVFGTTVGPIKLTKTKYLIGASVITTINLSALALLVSGNVIGLYIGIFTSSVFGILQAVVHTIGYFKEGRVATKVGAGFYSSIPLAAVGGVLLYNIILVI